MLPADTESSPKSDSTKTSQSYFEIKTTFFKNHFFNNSFITYIQGSVCVCIYIYIYLPPFDLSIYSFPKS